MRSEVKYRIEQIRKGNIIKGYKKTAHRIMPNEWDNYTIGDIVKFEGGAQPPRSEFISYPKEGYIRLIQIRDYKTNEYLTFIPLKKARKFCTEDDVMIGRYGPPIFQILRGIKGAYNVALMKAIPAEDKLHKDYLYYYLQNETLFILIDKLSRRSSGQTGIDIEALNQFPFPLPPKNEQERIINIIKTWDKAIELKEKLIEEKKKQKNGLMQKLLTGKVRLPGFDDAWEEVKFGKVFKFLNKERVSEPQNYKLLTVKLHLKGIEATEKYPNDTKNGRPYYLREPNEILIGRQNYHNGGIGIVPSNMKNYIASNAISSLTTIKGDLMFLFYYISNVDFYKRVGHMIGGTGQKEISETTMKNLVLRIPKSLEEQKKIGEVLKTADNEIDLLEKELESLKQQKKGLMQLLLTGIIRVNTQENEKR